MTVSNTEYYSRPVHIQTFRLQIVQLSSYDDRFAIQTSEKERVEQLNYDFMPETNNNLFDK